VDQKVKVTPREDGAVISVEGYNIVVTVTPAEEMAPRITVTLVEARLGEHLQELDVGAEEEGIVVKPKGFLGREKFAAIAAVIEELGGRYVSAGKESRFLIPEK
jgi:hypothetical protein